MTRRSRAQTPQRIGKSIISDLLMGCNRPNKR
nr:MAG TPA: hypothetical protein [Caudoviricetes sp.]